MSTEIGPGRRTTIKDIAERAGVSKGAVSYALNGRPGVSEETRDRILAIAEELGWYPNRAARSLSASRADACGLILARPASTIALEPFFMEFIAGVEACLSPRAIGLTIQLVGSVEEEIESYRRWFGEHRVDGVFVFDIVQNDTRAEALKRDRVARRRDRRAARRPSSARCLARRGVRRDRGRAVPGGSRAPQDRPHRGRFGVRPHRGADARVQGDPFASSASRRRSSPPTTRPRSGTRATRRLLSAPKPPTAIIFDSDLLAVTGLGVAQQMGFSVPDDLSLIGWDDSLISRVVHPPLTAITRDIGAYGATAAAHLLQVIEGETSADIEVPARRIDPAREHRSTPRRRSRKGPCSADSGRSGPTRRSLRAGIRVARCVNSLLTLNRISD